MNASEDAAEEDVTAAENSEDELDAEQLEQRRDANIAAMLSGRSVKEAAWFVQQWGA